MKSLQGVSHALSAARFGDDDYNYSSNTCDERANREILNEREWAFNFTGSESDLPLLFKRRKTMVRDNNVGVLE